MSIGSENVLLLLLVPFIFICLLSFSSSLFKICLSAKGKESRQKNVLLFSFFMKSQIKFG